jgi:POT family proton-dependent oligopeptide transporter
MTASASGSHAGLGFDTGRAGHIYGIYTGSVWLATIGGGLIADWILGQYRSVLLGGVLITLGHFTLAFHALSFFYTGLGLIVVGTGLLKPNVSTLVGSLYAKGDPRRDAGFSIFYMGINLGATLGPLIAGYLAQRVDWHIGFACAGVGMTLGLIQYVLGAKYLKPAMDKLGPRGKSGAGATEGSASLKLTSTEWKQIAAVFVFFIFASIFWGAYEQAGSTLNLFADRYTRLTVFGLSFPSSWFQSVPAFFVIVLAPIFAWLWVKLGSKEPSSPAKFAIGLFFAGLGFLILVPAAGIAQKYGLRVSLLWLIAVYFVLELGELSLSPVALSMVTKLAPVRLVGLMMGVWFLSIAVGDIIAGSLTSLFKTLPLPELFGAVALTAMMTSAVLFFLIKPIRKLMSGVR